MDFSTAAFSLARPVWDMCAETPLVRGLISGAPDGSGFAKYLAQDELYLSLCASALLQAAGTAQRRSRPLLESLFASVEETRLRVRRLCRRRGLRARMERQTLDYSVFVWSCARLGALRCAAAVLPCMFSYPYIFRHAARPPLGRASPCGGLIRESTAPGYIRLCRRWAAEMDRLTRGLPRGELELLLKIYLRASLFELGFWLGCGGRGRKQGRRYT